MEKLFKVIPKPFIDKLDQKNLSLASDAFFPFRDNIDHMSKYGINYIVQPGGSVQDNTIIKTCNEYGMTMSFTDKRMFLH